MQTQIVTREPKPGILTQAQFEHMVAQLPKPSVSNETSSQYAGFLLGVQYAIMHFRGFVR